MEPTNRCNSISPYLPYTLLRHPFWDTPTHPHTHAHTYAPTHTWSLAVSLCGYRPTCTSSRKWGGGARERERERGVSDRIWHVFAYIHKKMYTCVMGAWVYMRVCTCVSVCVCTSFYAGCMRVVSVRRSSLSLSEQTWDRISRSQSNQYLVGYSRKFKLVDSTFEFAGLTRET